MSINRRSFLGAVTGAAAAAASLVVIRRASSGESNLRPSIKAKEPTDEDSHSAYVRMRYRCLINTVRPGSEHLHALEPAEFLRVDRLDKLVAGGDTELVFFRFSPKRECVVTGHVVLDQQENHFCDYNNYDDFIAAIPGKDLLCVIEVPRS